MKKLLLFSFIGLSFAWNANAQVYQDGFNDDGSAPTAPYWGAPPTGLTVEHTAGSGTTTITGNGQTPAYQSENYSLYGNPDNGGSGNPVTVDMSGTNDSIFVVAKSSVAGTKLRVDIKDANGYDSDAGTITNEVTLTTSYAVYKFVYSDPKDEYSTSGCSPASPCTLDKTQIVSLNISPDNAAGAFNGVVTIDYVQIGGDASTVPSLTGVKAAQQIASSRIYPNPTSDKANIDLSLKSESNLKITLTDMLGKQVDAIETTGTDFTGSFNTSNLTKGMYTVNYYVNGQPAKAELLLVK